MKRQIQYMLFLCCCWSTVSLADSSSPYELWGQNYTNGGPPPALDPMVYCCYSNPEVLTGNPVPTQKYSQAVQQVGGAQFVWSNNNWIDVFGEATYWQSLSCSSGYALSVAQMNGGSFYLQCVPLSVTSQCGWMSVSACQQTITQNTATANQ
ncbi:MAG: hypothetical protein HY939_03455 [Gammaproteobacteria bacterium]|nr:hypothetical protein [Gammaproteobacteria bacterium]